MWTPFSCMDCDSSLHGPGKAAHNRQCWQQEYLARRRTGNFFFWQRRNVGAKPEISDSGFIFSILKTVTACVLNCKNHKHMFKSNALRSHFFLKYAVFFLCVRWVKRHIPIQKPQYALIQFIRIWFCHLERSKRKQNTVACIRLTLDTYGCCRREISVQPTRQRELLELSFSNERIKYWKLRWETASKCWPMWEACGDQVTGRQDLHLTVLSTQ